MSPRQQVVVLGLLSLLAVEASAQTRLPSGFEDSLLVDGLTKPTALAVAPDGRLFITEQGGQLRVVRDGRLLPTPFLSVPVDSTFEQGLLGVALSPAVARASVAPDAPIDPGKPPPTGGGQATTGETAYVYVYYTAAKGPANRLSRFTVSTANTDIAEPGSERVLLDGIPAGNFHNGGALHFLPDGTLLVAVGDAQNTRSAQSLGALTGKLLRVDTGGRAPADNPFVDDPEAFPEIWALGLRNPFTFAVEPGSGRVFANDVGKGSIEEIDHIDRGNNYGWPVCEGPCDTPGTTDPLYAYPHPHGCAVTGGIFASGLRFPREYEGSYFYSDYCGRWLERLDGSGQSRSFAIDMPTDVVDLDVSLDGALLYLSHERGKVRQIEFVGEGNRKPVAVATAQPAQGMAPLSVVLSATDSRDPDGDPLRYEWDAGDGSPLTTEPISRHTYTRDGAYSARVTVDDGQGGRASARVQVRVGQPPSVRILAPPPGTSFRPGDVLTFRGEAEDPEDGPLPPSALVWYLELHHHPESDPLHHTHPLLGPVVGAGGSLQLPDTLHDEDIWVRIWLNAKDSSGLSGRAFVDVLPAGS